MTVQMIITAVLIAAGFLFMLASLIGIARFPDFFARLHAQGVGDTLGAFLIIAGMAVAAGAGLLSVKLLLIFVIIVLTNPIGTNLMMIAAINKEDYQGYSTFMSGRKKAGDKKHHRQTAAAEEVIPPASEKNVAGTEKLSSGKEPSAQEHKETARAPVDEKHRTENKANSNEKNKEKNADNNRRKNRSGGKQDGRRRKPSMNMNKAELIEAAKERGIEVPEEATKREILGMIYSGDDRNHR